MARRELAPSPYDSWGGLNAARPIVGPAESRQDPRPPGLVSLPRSVPGLGCEELTVLFAQPGLIQCKCIVAHIERRSAGRWRAAPPAPDGQNEVDVRHEA